MTKEQQHLIAFSVASGAVGALAIFVIGGAILLFGFPAQAHQILALAGPTISSGTNQTAQATNTAVAQNDTIIPSVVKQTSPAVVSITIKQNIQQVDTNADPFQQFFGMPSPFGNGRGRMQRPPTQEPSSPSTQQVEVGGGSGFLVSQDGYIVTNKHVVNQDGATYDVTLTDGTTHTANVIALDPTFDIAIIKIDGTGYPFLTFENSDGIQVGQGAIAIGNALAEFQNTVSAGIISGLSRNIVVGDNMGGSEQLSNLIQTDAAINPGNSGGPLLNLDGKVIGINVAEAGAQGIGFAIPSNIAKTAVDQVISTGKITRAFLGVRYVVINADVQKQHHLSVEHGVLVLHGATSQDLSVIPGGPADKAGIKENDIILSVNGTSIDANHDLASMIRMKQPGESVTLHLLRNGKEMDLQVTLEESR